MATSISDVITPENYANYSVEESIELNELFQSGVIVTNPIIQAQANNGGIAVHLPVWADLGTDAPNLSSDDPSVEATPLTPKAFKNIARVAFLNNAWSSADLAAEVAGSDPMQMVQGKINQYWAGQYQRRLISTIEGMCKDSVANHDSDLVYSDLTGADNGVFTAKGFIKAAQTLGDRKALLKTLVVHSEIQTAMSESDLISYLQDSNGNLTIPTYRGCLLLVDDQCKVESDANGDIYSSYLLGAGAFGGAAGRPKMPLEIDRNGLGGNGAGIETLITRVSPIIHPHGYQFTSSSVAGESATLAELELAENWKRECSSRKAIPLVVYKARAEFIS